MSGPIVLDALLLATLGGTSLIGGALLASRSTRWPNQVRYQLLSYSLLAGLTILALVLAFQPGPVGCLTSTCHADRELADHTARVQQYHTAAAAGKFADLATSAASTDGTPASRAERVSARFGSLVLLIWFTGLVTSLARVARRRWLARSFIKQAAPVMSEDLEDRLTSAVGRLGFRRRVRLLQHPELAAPAVAGTLRPVLLLPLGTTSGSDVDMVLLHELGHLRRHDPLITLLGEFASAFFWFNPLVWFAARKVGELQEIVADSHVIQNGVRPSRYARFLLRSLRQLTNQEGSVMPHVHSIAGQCLMETRVRSILDPRAGHGPPPRSLTTTVALCFAFVCVGLSFAPEALQARGLLTQEVQRGEGLERSLLNEVSLDSIVRPLFIDHMAERYIAGAGIAVVHEGRLVYRAGFGRREVFNEIPVDADRTIWRIGSITKVLTGVAIMQLVERDLIDLDADVNDYLTEFKLPDVFEDPVRVRHLLTHTAGFDQIGLGRHVFSREEVRPLGAFLAEYLSRIRPPDVVSTYDTYGITLAGYLVEQLTGLSYEDYLIQHIFEPLAMHRSGIVVPPALEADVATGYGFAGHWEAERWEFMNTDPASTANSTLTDMANFAIMLLGGGRLGDSRVLSEASTSAMLDRQWTNHPDHPGYGYTLWEDRSYGVPAFSHGGSMSGFGALLYLIPQHDLGVFIVNNQESGSLHNVVLSGLFEALLPGRPETPPLRARSENSVDLTRFTGTYANSMHHHANPEVGWRRQPFELETAEGQLVFQGSPAFPVGPLAFQRDDGLLITFRADERGEIKYMFVNQSVFEKLN